VASTGLWTAALALVGLSVSAGETAPALVAGLLALCASMNRAVHRHREASLVAEVAELRRQARVEGLTMLRNRQAFKEDLDHEILRADRTGRPVCLVVLSLEIEPWKEQRSDAQRRALAQTMSAAVRKVDVGYRIGTDEFALILPDTRARYGLAAARRVRKALLAEGAPCGHATAGVAEAGPGIDRRRLFRHAYVALLAAGRNGGPGIVVYSPELERAGANAEPERATAVDEAPAGR
jgi:diguanylate cyclase (GGDEF)-like protein